MTSPAPPQRRSPAVMATYRAGQLVIAAAEAYALAECVCYTVTGGTHLHDIIAEKWDEFRARVEFRAQVLDTLHHIRRLPEDPER